MKVQDWIVSVSCGGLAGSDGWCRRAVVGPACASTVEAALHLAKVPQEMRAEIRSAAQVRAFVEGALDPDARGYIASSPVESPWSWCVGIGPVHEVLR